MPVITIDMRSGRTPAQKRQLVQEFTASFCRICQVKPEVVTIIIREIPDENWASGGKTKAQALEEQGAG